MLIDDVISAMCLGGSGGCGGRRLALWGEEGNREATVAGGSLSKPRQPPGDLFGLLPSGLGSLRSLVALRPQLCGASAKVLFQGVKK